MKNKSYLTNAIADIQSKLKKNNLKNPNEARNHYLSLEKSQKSKYIELHEKYWHQFSIISNILSDLLYAIKKLKEVKQIGHKKNQPKTSKQIKEYEEKLNCRHKEVSFLTKNIYNDTSMLLLFAKDNFNVLHNDYKKYPELNYIRLLRNKYLQHPNCSFQPTNTIKIPNNSSKEISTSDIGPKHGGWVFIFEYYLNNINDKNYLKKSDLAKQKQNKIDFISVADNKEYWKNLIINDKELFFKIKAYGLPDFNQERTAIDLKRIFNDYIYDYFN